jgi:hypothetical protein
VSETRAQHIDGEVAPSGLRGIDLQPGYDSSDQVLETFYVPALSRATAYDRSVGYFRSSALSVAARGLSRFINGGGQVRLLCGAEITPADRDALLGRSSLDGSFARRLADRLITDSDVDQKRLQVLAWLIREHRLEVRIAIAVDANGDPIVGGEYDPYFHEKIGVLRDTHGDGVAFQGSVNESATAWTKNFESFSVYTSWGATSTHFSFWANKFQEHWAGRMAGFRVYPLPTAVRERLLSIAPDEAPDSRDIEEPAPLGVDVVVARYLQVAPRLIGAEALAEATVGVDLFPHQRQVAERLAGLYPRSWLVADEVGLGKTISAGMALRRLTLEGRVRRALILAPANVCRQWQDELFEKFGLWVPRLDANKIYGAHPSDVHTAGPNPYAEHPLLIASSHLARRPEHHRLILDAGPYDLVVVDEAHHARRTHAAENQYRPGRLLELLDRLANHGATRALWLLTGTPMQIDPVELRDLLVHIGLQGTLAERNSFNRYFYELTKDDDSRVAWEWLDQALRDTPRMPRTAADEAMLEHIRRDVGPVATARIERFGTAQLTASEIVSGLDGQGAAALRSWLRTIGPIGQLVTRHSRRTLKSYRDRGLLSENLADRDPQSIVIPFDVEEQNLYDQLDELIDRLMLAHGSSQGAGFILTVYRRRLTSSWAAIRKTLTRRLDHEELLLDDDLLVEADDADLQTTNTGAINQTQALPLTSAEIDEIRGYVERMSVVSDSKFDRLLTDLNAARDVGRSTIVFTQFADTLEDLRDRLSGAYHYQMATFTGAGGRIFRDLEGWVEISKRDLIEAVRARRVTVLLATDAASEGLNLQTCSYLINYDMPWNPMRVEQRIGRIDRLGQQADVVKIRSYFIPNTVEESVYRALATRIDLFSGMLGCLQPILGSAEQAFRQIFRAPRSERHTAEEQAVNELVHRLGHGDQLGLDIVAEDPLPLPTYPSSPVTHEDLRHVLVDRFSAVLDTVDRPVTWTPGRASRDPEGWTALATYGHPRLGPVLEKRAGDHLPDDSALTLSTANGGPIAAVRADRTPPVPVRNLADIDDLGPATARGEAERLAESTAAAALEQHRRYEQELAGLQSKQAADNLRQRFVSLVRDTIAAGCAASRSNGAPGADPITIWYDLGMDATSPWAYARAMQDRLGVPISQLITADLGVALEPISPRRWADIRQRSGADLTKLIDEFSR